MMFAGDGAGYVSAGGDMGAAGGAMMSGRGMGSGAMMSGSGMGSGAMMTGGGFVDGSMGLANVQT